LYQATLPLDLAIDVMDLSSQKSSLVEEHAYILYVYIYNFIFCIKHGLVAVGNLVLYQMKYLRKICQPG